MDAMLDCNLLQNKKGHLVDAVTDHRECGGESGSWDGGRMWRMARQSQAQVGIL